MAFCPTCGVNVKPSARFCAKCGAALHGIVSSTASGTINSAALSFSADFVHIRGEYYTVSNGFMSKAKGEVELPVSSILSVESVKRRSKKIMYAVLLIMGVAIALIYPTIIAYNYVTGLIDGSFWDLNYMFIGRHAHAFAMLAIVFMFASIPATIVGLVYFFNGRHFVELTTMRGTYRVAVPRGDVQMESVVKQLQQQI